MLKGINGAIFDLDGTLLDSMGVWNKVDETFLGRRNIVMPCEYPSMINGLSFYDAAVYTIDFFHLNEKPETIMKEWNDLAIDEYSQNVLLKKGAKDFLIKLKNHHIKIAIATALTKNLAKLALKHLEVYHLFDSFTWIDEVTRDKSYPDIYELTAKKLMLAHHEIIVFEDILKGIKSAKSINMKVVGCFDETSIHEINEIMDTADYFIYDFMEIL